MRSPKPLYPVDRYLVQNNINNELVNIINEDIWNPDPALRPEDEITLRKLHEMLCSTADDLRLLSGELARHREPGLQVKTIPTPLDEEFNEKVHIEEIVNAKFHGYKIIDGKNKSTPLKNVQKDVVDGLIKTIADIPKRRHVVTTGVQVNEAPKRKITNKNLVKSQTKVLQVNNGKGNINNIKNNNLNNSSCIGYNEFSYKYIEPNNALQMKKNLQLQELPKINIRSELKVQNVLQLDILPDNSSTSNLKNLRNTNTTVVFMKHESDPVEAKHVNVNDMNKIKIDMSQTPSHKPVDRKVSKMQTCESSDSTEHFSSKIQRKFKLLKPDKTLRRTSPALPASSRSYAMPKHLDKQGRPHSSLNEWKQKLNAVYGHTSMSKERRKAYSKPKKEPHSATYIKLNDIETNKKRTTKNAEYIPYTKLTIGGVKVSDVEKEIGSISDKGDIPLGPILEKILSNQENSTQIESSKILKINKTKNVLSASDENLLKEVIDIQNKVSNTLSEDVEINSLSDEANDTYADDFDDERSESIDQFSRHEAEGSPKNEESSKDSNNTRLLSGKENINSKIRNETFTKSNSLSFKNSVDVFEYVHEIDTQDSATQSNMSKNSSIKETQTSPTYDKNNIHSIHNDLRPSADPMEEVEQMFKLEKEFIKKLIMDEYGDLLEKTLNKPSTSGSLYVRSEINEHFSQKDTQTSPAHVKNVMTSPTRLTTRTTSPLVLLKVNQHTSPMPVPSNDEPDVILKNDLDKSSISLNLSSPRFNLRLPQTSRDVISNLGTKFQKRDTYVLLQNRSKLISSSSSSLDEDYSSSDISSLGEIEKISRKYRKLKLSTTSEQSSSPTPRRNSELSIDVLNLRSEGEISLGQIKGKVKNNGKASKSEGEMSLGELLRRSKK